MHLLSRWVLGALSLMCAAYVVPGIHVNTIYTALIVALVLGLLNAIVRPILVILTLPITVLTLGLFMLVINGGLFWFAARVIDGFSVDSFLPALVGALLVSVINSVGGRLLAHAYRD